MPYLYRLFSAKEPYDLKQRGVSSSEKAPHAHAHTLTHTDRRRGKSSEASPERGDTQTGEEEKAARRLLREETHSFSHELSLSF